MLEAMTLLVQQLAVTRRCGGMPKTGASKIRYEKHQFHWTAFACPGIFQYGIRPIVTCNAL